MSQTVTNASTKCNIRSTAVYPSTKFENCYFRLLNLLLDPEFVLNENQALGVITSVVENRFGRSKAWLFYREEFKNLVAK